MNRHRTLGTPGILLGDTNLVWRVNLAEELRQAGLIVWEADDGWEALSLYRRYGHAIDLVLLDLDLPGLAGAQTLAVLQQLNPDVRCCLVRGRAGAHTDEELLEQGALAILNRPFSAEEVAPVLWRLLGRASRTPLQNARCPSILSWRLWGQDLAAPVAPKRGAGTPSPGVADHSCVGAC